MTTFIGAAVPLVLYGGAVGLNESGVDIPLSSVLGTAMVVAFLLVLAALAVGWYAWYSEEPVRLHCGPGVAAGTHRLLGGPDARRHPVSP